MSNPISGWWNRAGAALRATALTAATVLLAAMLWASFWLLRTEYGVLFADLAPADAAVIIGRLKHDKVPYRLGSNERSIEVPAKRVHEVRIGLMSGNLPLSGNVGFEIFDQQGFGATEQAQQVSYQRALQGELARTIGALEQVASVRVHLVLPQSSLFTRDRQQASAAVTLAMEPGTTLESGQIAGVQRLVAAAVAGLEPGKVVITDQRGITLSAGDASTAGAADARLQIKREVESYLAKKVGDLLAGAFGNGQAIVTVDATLNFDSAKTTVQDLLPGRSNEGSGEGLVVRRRQMTAGSGGTGAVWASAVDGEKTSAQPGSSMEVEYQYGRRVEEVVTTPGAMARMSIGVIVPGPLEGAKRQRIAELVRVAAGFNEQRGDAISVQALDELAVTVSQPESAPGRVVVPHAASEPAPQPTPTPARAHDAPIGALAVSPTPQQWLLTAPVAAAMLCGVLLIWRSRRRTRLSLEARQTLLADLERALADSRFAAGRLPR